MISSLIIAFAVAFICRAQFAAHDLHAASATTLPSIPSVDQSLPLPAPLGGDAAPPPPPPPAAFFLFFDPFGLPGFFFSPVAALPLAALPLLLRLLGPAAAAPPRSGEDPDPAAEVDLPLEDPAIVAVLPRCRPRVEGGLMDVEAVAVLPRCRPRDEGGLMDVEA